MAGRRTNVERAAVGIFFLVVAAFGLLVYDDYGISWDEPGLVHYGNLLLDHFAPGGEWETFENLRFYGPLGPVLMVAADRVLAGPTFPDAHLVNFGFFLAGAATFYALCRFQFDSRWWGLAGAAAFVLSPRVFSHGMVNPKDMPLMTLFVVAVYLLVRFLESRNLWWLVGCGAATALGFAVRISASFLVALVLLGLAVDVLARRERRFVRGSAVAFGTYLVVFAVLAYALWPFLWTDPVGHLREAFALMVNFHEGPSVVLYRGDVIAVGELPWHYLLVWIGITTPPAYLLLSLPGIAVAIRGLRERTRARYFVVYLAWLVAPVAAIAIRRPPLYDEWRQALFVYPALLLFAVAGTRSLVSLLRRRRRRLELRVAAIVAAYTAVWLVGTMFRLHPYQGVYFNAFATDAPDEAFEVDYWGLSYAEAQQRLLDANEGMFDVYTCGGPGAANEQLLSDEDAARIQYVDAVEDADYSFCAPRPTSPRPAGTPAFTVERDGLLLLEVHRLR